MSEEVFISPCESLHSQVADIKRKKTIEPSDVQDASRQLRYVIAESLWHLCSEPTQDLLMGDDDISVRCAAYLSMRLAGGPAHEE